RRRIPRAALFAPALLAGAAAYYLRPAGSTAPLGYVTVAVDHGPIERVVNATGAVNPVTAVLVGTYVSGPIQAIDATFNSTVKKGQRIAKIDPAPFAVKVREAEANLQNAQAKVAGNRADLKLKKLLLERNRVLLRRNLIAQNDLDTAETSYEQSSAQLALDQAAVAQARATLEEAQVNLRYTDILSPVDVVAVDNPGLELKPGMTANVSITTAKRDHALRIPVRALRFHPDGAGPGTPNANAKEESAVYVLASDGTLRRVEVEAGIRDNQHA